MENTLLVSESTLYSAFIQTLGKSTYSVDSVSNDIINNWDKLEQSLQILIKKEIKEALETDKAGLDIDKKIWNKILKLKIKE